jgi:hypothetical protein
VVSAATARAMDAKGSSDFHRKSPPAMLLRPYLRRHPRPAAHTTDGAAATYRPWDAYRSPTANTHSAINGESSQDARLRVADHIVF